MITFSTEVKLRELAWDCWRKLDEDETVPIIDMLVEYFKQANQIITDGTQGIEIQ